MKLRKYTSEDLKKAVKSSVSYRETLIKLNVIPAGGNYATLKKAIKYFEINISHFLGHRSNLGKIFGPKRPIEEYLTNKQTIQSFKLKKRLLKEGLLLPICNNCNLDIWLNKPIPLELDHIDGNNLNNEFSNLQLLCPNCHALTPTYRGKNMLKA
ncbi:hypothetical protein DRQ25_10630 [Candidatus Fermentibacteria bacterium]|nr:MAG: hypothetical protein DRQ25_10630 [Candidatus Fermentibacteria bacterium]